MRIINGYRFALLFERFYDTQFDKRKKKTKKKNHGSNEQKQGNRKKTLVNSHATLTARLTEQ